MAGAIIDSTSVHWNTPPLILDPVYEFFYRIPGSKVIDLDPCSNPGSIVDSTIAYRLDRGYDGLIFPWGPKHKNIYWNPPYGSGERVCEENCTREKCIERGAHNLVDVPGLSSWVSKAYRESVKNGSEAVGLIPAAVETKWWQNIIFRYAAGITWLNRRVKFIGAKSGCPRPLAIVYFGTHYHYFREVFSKLGATYQAMSVHGSYGK